MANFIYNSLLFSSATTRIAVNAPTFSQELTANNSTTASWQSQNVIAQLQKCTDVISLNLTNQCVITNTQPSLTPTIVLCSTGVYKINIFTIWLLFINLLLNTIRNTFFVYILYVNNTLY